MEPDYDTRDAPPHRERGSVFLTRKKAASLLGRMYARSRYLGKTATKWFLAG
jgi:hypothetical protein